MRLLDHTLHHLAAVFLNGNNHITPIPAAEDAAPPTDDTGLPGNLRHSGHAVSASITITFVSAVRFPPATGPRRGCDKVRAKKFGDPSVIVEPELVLLRLFVNPCPASDHLIKFDRRFQIPEENHSVETLNVYASFQQIHRAGYERALAGTAHRLDQLRSVVHAAHALEGVVILRLPAVRVAPRRVKIVHLHRHAVRMNLAVAEDDGLLLRPAIFTKQLE